MINKETTDLLGLTKNEINILGLLKKGANSMAVSDISRVTKMPRMTVYLGLESLKKRGLTDYKRKGKRRFWYMVDTKTFTSNVIHALTALTGGSEIGITTNNSGFTIYRGIDSLYKSWESLKDLPPHTRVYGIQPTASIKLSVKKLDWKRLKPLQETILGKPIIIDGVIPEDYYPVYAKLFAHDKDLQKRSLESFIGRGTDMTFIDERYFKDSETELLILPNVAYLTDWRNEVAIEIKDAVMLAFLRQLYELAKGYGRKVDQNAYIKDLLEKLDK
jgi:DNA-binding transcriptional ArsR family regulator